MNQFNTSNFTTRKVYRIQSGYSPTSIITFEVQDGTNLVRMRHFNDPDDPRGYIPYFSVHPSNWTEPRKIDSDTHYDIQVARDVWNYLTGGDESNRAYKPYTRIADLS